MKKYTENLTINITETQFKTLDKLRERNFKIGDFIRKAIQEKINREYKELIEKPKKEHCPF